jgi:DNA repair protein RecO (recombination protein O)
VAGSRYRVREGIVVRRTPLPSGDVVATLLSADGKWRAVARKGRLPGGNPGRLSLFHDVTVQAYHRREGDLAVVAQVRLNGALPRLADPGVYPYAHLLAELADRLTVDVHLGEPLHAWLASGLRGLDRDPDPERVALVHAWMLLRVAGLGPDPGRSGSGRDVGAGDERGAPEGAGPRFDVAEGRIVRDGPGLALSEPVADELRVLVAGRAQDALREPLSDRPGHWRLLARYVAWHVDELRSLRALAGAAASRPVAAVPEPAP